MQDCSNQTVRANIKEPLKSRIHISWSK